MATGNEKQAAEILTWSPRTLQDKRSRGGGPPFYKLGHRVVYDLDEVRDWMQQHRRSSTADQPQTA